MELTNMTRFPAKLFRTAIDDDRLAAALVARITYDILGAEVSPAEEQLWPVSSEPWECGYGVMDSDQLFYRKGVDVFVFGHARPADRGVRRMRVALHVGPSWRREVAVFGRRVWRRGVLGLAASEPEVIEAIPLTLSHSFGGRTRWDGLDVPYPLNPDGIGCYNDAASAVDGPLPNIEEVDQLISTWDARPLPAGLGLSGPMSGLRLARLTDPQSDAGGGVSLRFDASFFNAAHPRMIVPTVEPGTRISAFGVAAGAAVTVDLPRVVPRIRVRFDNEVVERPLAIDQLGLEIDNRRIFIGYRFPFRYVVVPEQLREVHMLL